MSFSVGYFKIPKNSRGISSASVHQQPFHEIPSLEFQYAFQVRHGREHVATTLQDSSSDCCFVTAMGLETGMEVGGVSVSVFLSEQRKKRAKEGSLSLLHFAYLCVCAHGVDIVVGTFILGENILQAQTRRYFEVKDLAKVNTGIGLVIYL